MRNLLLTMSLGILCGLGLASTAHADEDAWIDHSKKPHKTIIIGKDAILPSKTTMSASDVVEFKNMWSGVLSVIFTEPKDVTAKIRCGLISGKPDPEAKVPPWDLFQANAEGLSASIPPGRFASLCSLAPGDYSFIVQDLYETGDEEGVLAEKGTITVK
jgi:hypothetical protein